MSQKSIETWRRVITVSTEMSVEVELFLFTLCMSDHSEHADVVTPRFVGLMQYSTRDLICGGDDAENALVCHAVSSQADSLQ